MAAFTRIEMKNSISFTQHHIRTRERKRLRREGEVICVHYWLLATSFSIHKINHIEINHKFWAFFEIYIRVGQSVTLCAPYTRRIDREKSESREPCTECYSFGFFYKCARTLLVGSIKIRSINRSGI